MYKWDAGEALKIVEAEKITSLSGVPVMAREIITHPDFDKTDIEFNDCWRRRSSTSARFGYKN